MRYRKVRTVIHLISTFGNVTLHCCTPAHAQDIHSLYLVATVSDHETSSVRWPIRRRMHQCFARHKVICIWQSTFGAMGRQRRPGIDREQRALSRAALLAQKLNNEL